MHSDPVPAARPAPGITPGRDGVLRWVHEISLWKNPTVLITTAKVLLLAASVPALLVGVLALVEGDGIGAALGSVGHDIAGWTLQAGQAHQRQAHGP